MHFALLVLHRTSEGVRGGRFGHVKKNVLLDHLLSLFGTLNGRKFPLLATNLDGGLQVVFEEHQSAKCFARGFLAIHPRNVHIIGDERRHVMFFNSALALDREMTKLSLTLQCSQFEFHQPQPGEWDCQRFHQGPVRPDSLECGDVQHQSLGVLNALGPQFGGCLAWPQQLRQGLALSACRSALPHGKEEQEKTSEWLKLHYHKVNEKGMERPAGMSFRAICGFSTERWCRCCAKTS